MRVRAYASLLGQPGAGFTSARIEVMVYHIGSNNSSSSTIITSTIREKMNLVDGGGPTWTFHVSQGSIPVPIGTHKWSKFERDRIALGLETYPSWKPHLTSSRHVTTETYPTELDAGSARRAGA
ncbi:uncharacterized protein PV07_12780 [Cladophialophora immunda]|uniref:Uncharacterized protein n=1 Tax=Cladophialophora immunda TaxID=569365 RepID=A0A0D2AAJ0_9EURO|nr:uncharacterized protein PV07_12780 [Cladophialophora immunda]KIW21792.1 hypothetical protein PV07_12780 [Cladophialophora immunda]